MSSGGRKKQQAGSISRVILIALALLAVAVTLIIPLVAVFVEAFRSGAAAYWTALSDSDTLAAIILTLKAAAFSVMLNTVFGLGVAWLVTRFEFPGRKLLITLIDVPLAVSPVIAGMIFVLLYGTRGLFGGALHSLGVSIIFSEPGIILATTFVTLPFVARELIPLMLAQGVQEEEAALTMGASGWQVLRYVTLPNIKWALLYGMILCNARAMGEFGAVSVVSGHIRGKTNTLPLHIEILYNEYSFAAAFAVSSLLTLVALLTLVIKEILEYKTPRLGIRRPI